MGEQCVTRPQQICRRRRPFPARLQTIPAACTFYFTLVFSWKCKRLFALTLLFFQRHAKTPLSEIRLSLLTDGSADDIVIGTHQNSNTTVTSPDILAAGPPVPQSSWICRFSDGIASPCSTSRNNSVSPGSFCLPGLCCSRLNMWCVTEPHSCNEVDYDTVYSPEKCSCLLMGKQCHPYASCVDQLKPLGGVFCQCKAGFVGDGRKCGKDPCEGNNRCGGKKCISNSAGGFTCECGEDYVNTTVAGKPTCRKKNACDVDPDACGPPDGVRECRSKGDNFACICKKGWKAPPGLNQKCQLLTDTSPCYADPCGAEEGVVECTELGTDSYTCTCRPGYSVQIKDGKEICQLSTAAVCDSHPCGQESLVAACISTDSGYTCECKPGAKLVRTDDAPYCADDFSSLIVIGIVTGFFVILLGGYQLYRWRHKAREEDENYNLYNTDIPFS